MSVSRPCISDGDQYMVIHRTYEDYKSISWKKTNRNTQSWTFVSCCSYLLCFLLVVLSCSLVTAESNGCDFIGSGLEQDPGGVQPVYLSCSAGRIQWQYPRAALRVLLRHPLPGREFHGCVRPDPDSTFRGARVYIEGHRSLIPLLSPGENPNDGPLRCFTSHRGQVALYVEAEASTVNSIVKEVAAFEYDLRPLPRGEVYRPDEECRPCSNKELVQLYCAADFVARGQILGIQDHPRQEYTSVHFKASKVYQQSMTVFTPIETKHKKSDHSHFSGTEIFTQIESNLLMDNENSAPNKNENKEEVTYYSGRLQVPIHCGAQSGPGEFLVLGNVRLGHPILRCASKIRDWDALAKKAQAEAPCLLEV